VLGTAEAVASITIIDGPHADFTPKVDAFDAFTTFTFTNASRNAESVKWDFGNFHEPSDQDVVTFTVKATDAEQVMRVNLTAFSKSCGSDVNSQEFTIAAVNRNDRTVSLDTEFKITFAFDKLTKKTTVKLEAQQEALTGLTYSWNVILNDKRVTVKGVKLSSFSFSSFDKMSMRLDLTAVSGGTTTKESSDTLEVTSGSPRHKALQEKSLMNTEAAKIKN
jgi:PKD repeat protein